MLARSGRLPWSGDYTFELKWEANRRTLPDGRDDQLWEERNDRGT